MSMGGVLLKGRPVVFTSKDSIPEVVCADGKEHEALELMEQMGLIKRTRVSNDGLNNPLDAAMRLFPEGQLDTDNDGQFIIFTGIKKRYAIVRLTAAPQDGDPQSFITIHEGAGGWNSSLWRWAGDDSDGFPGYEPFNTGYTNTSYASGPPTREAAIEEAEEWAEALELPLWIPPIDDREDI